MMISGKMQKNSRAQLMRYQTAMMVKDDDDDDDEHVPSLLVQDGN